MSAFIQFCKGLDRHIYKTFGPLFKQSEAEAQAVISTSLDSSEDCFSDRNIGREVILDLPKLYKKSDLMKYSILSWYMDPYTRFELQEFLRKRCTSLHLYEIETLYLYSKEVMQYTLFRENDCLIGSLFGNILQPGVFENHYYRDLNKVLRKIRLKTPDRCSLKISYRKKPKKTVFRRGYNDKGSMPPFDKKARTEADVFKSRLDRSRMELEWSTKRLISTCKRYEYILEMKQRGIGT